MFDEIKKINDNEFSQWTRSAVYKLDELIAKRDAAQWLKDNIEGGVKWELIKEIILQWIPSGMAPPDYCDVKIAELNAIITRLQGVE